MAGNLGKNPGPVPKDDVRPWQKGKAKGPKKGKPSEQIEVDKNWMVDTGATISAITAKNRDKFKLKLKAGEAAAGAGEGALEVYTGLTMVFTAVDKDGKQATVECDLQVAVDSSETAEDVLGMDQLKHVHCKVDWDPEELTGNIILKPRKPGD